MTITPSKSSQKRTYSQHGLYALRGALKTIGNQDNWIENLGDVGKELKAWQASVITDLGGEENISAMERSIVELATKTHLLLASVDRFLLQQPSLVNKSKRQLFPVVLQRQQLADGLARYMAQLGFKRRPKPAPTIQDYMAARHGLSSEGESNQEDVATVVARE